MRKIARHRFRLKHVIIAVLVAVFVLLVWIAVVVFYNFNVVLKNQRQCKSHLKRIAVMLRLYSEEYAGPPPNVGILVDEGYLEPSMLRCPESGELYEINEKYMAQSHASFDENVLLLWDREPYHRRFLHLWFEKEGLHVTVCADSFPLLLRPEEFREWLEKAEQFVGEQEESK